MRDAAGSRQRLGPAVVGGFGIGTLLAHGHHLATHELTLPAAIFGVAIPVAFSTVLLGAGVWLAVTDREGHGTAVAAWTIVGAIAVVGVGSVEMTFQFVNGVPVEDAEYLLVTQATGGALLGFLVGVYDPPRLRSRRELEAERETANRLGRRLTVLNRVLRHDVRNRVNVIRGNAELIERGNGDVETAAATVKAQAAELAQLSEEAREIEALLSQEGVGTEPIDVGTLLHAKAHAVRRDHSYASVHVDVPEELVVTASPRLDVALDELVDNAIEHNHAADPSVWIEAAPADGGSAATVRIADDGPGIPPEEVAVLERGHETAMEHASGLGLWLVNWIVAESGGSVDFEERDPEGSAVVLTLPRPTSDGARSGTTDVDG